MQSSEPTLADWGEHRMIEWIRANAGPEGEAVRLGIGHDAAVIATGGRGEVVVTTDALIEGVHFRREWTEPPDLGHKSLAVNLSDLAAMAARPVACFLALGAPPDTPVRDVQGFFSGLLALAKASGCPLAGGDMVRAPQWVINITAIGAPGEGQAPARDQARPGQSVYVTGRPGESAAGLEALRRRDAQPELIGRHNRPAPRLAEARAISAAMSRPFAMIDVSDGLVNDAGQIARASGAGIILDQGLLPVPPALASYAASIGRDPLDFILYGGEDYELLFCTEADEAALRDALAPLGDLPLTRIGTVTEGRGVIIRDTQGRTMNSTDKTFRHY